MNCTYWEERIALYAGGDLDAVQAAQVERHLAECPGCRLFGSGLAESLECLRTAHGETIAAAHYTAVRARVLAAIDAERRRRRWLPALAAAAALAAAVLLGVRLRPPVRELPAVALRHAPPAAPWQLARTVRRPHPAPRPARAAERIVVKVETDNPDVVIFWISDTQGEN